MKAQINEYDGCYSIDLEAETMEDAALIIRMGMNRTKEVRSCDSFVREKGRFALSCVLGKAAKASSQVPHITG